MVYLEVTEAYRADEEYYKRVYADMDGLEVELRERGGQEHEVDRDVVP